MKTKVLGKTVATLVLLALAALAYFLLRGPVEYPGKLPAADKAAQGSAVLRFPPNAPQLAYLRIQPTVEVAEPASEPLPARVAYDEDRTARVSSPVAGRVLQIAAEPGDKVVAGQPLIWLDSPDYGSALTDAAKAEADLRQKQSAYERAKMLFEGQVLARKDLEAAEADLGQSRAEAQRAALKLRNFSQGPHVSSAGERVALRTPITGIVAERQVNPGAEVRPDATAPLYVITDPTHLWAVIDLSERYLGKVHTGQQVDIELDAFSGEVFPARVTSVGAALDASSRRVQVRCALPNPGERLKPEMYARATLIADSPRRVLRVPNSALVMTGLYYFVFVETAPGVLEKRGVTVSSQDRDYSIVTGGLKAGERIVTSGALLLNSELAGES